MALLLRASFDGTRGEEAGAGRGETWAAARARGGEVVVEAAAPGVAPAAADDAELTKGMRKQRHIETQMTAVKRE
jgi:hypothetical protein